MNTHKKDLDPCPAVCPKDCKRECPFVTPKVLPHFVINLFFLLGIFSALCFRSLLILDKTAPSFVRPVWYISVIGYIFFFAYRWIITERRRKYVRKSHVLNKIKSDHPLNQADKKILEYLLSSIDRSRENLNYLAIFILSIIAIILDIIL